MILFFICNYLKLFIRRYFCTGPKEGEINLVPQMDNCGLFKDILGARNIVAHHAQSLIYNVNNNAVEGFNSVVRIYIYLITLT